MARKKRVTDATAEPAAPVPAPAATEEQAPPKILHRWQRPPDDPQGPGLVCGNCGCRHFEVDHTRTVPGAIKRVRYCRNCGRMRVTLEQ